MSAESKTMMANSKILAMMVFKTMSVESKILDG
jgi:hypothetical protein